MKKHYSLRLDEASVDAMQARTGKGFTESLEVLIESFLKSQPLRVIKVEDSAYVITYEPIEIPEIDNSR